MKSFFDKVKLYWHSKKVQSWIEKLEEHVYITGIISSILVVLLCEMCGRGSILLGLQFAIKNPFVFGFNVFIIFFLWSFAVFFKRRIFYYLMIITIWGAIGITNGVILGYRNTPFTFVDIQLAKAGLAVMNNYMSKVKIISMFVRMAIIAGVLVIIFFKAPIYQGKRNFKKYIVSTLCICLAFFGSYQYGLKSGRLVDRFINLNLSYKAYGVPYCFTVTLLDNGIRKPMNYSPSSVEKVKKKIDTIKSEKPEKTPNIIILQLESFFDLKHMKGLQFSENPVPYFDYLRENYTSGFFRVPTYGAGTINTEFEVMSQMNKDFFGAGEYPYKSIMQNRNDTCETLAYILKKSGYSTHAIHNNRATFYDRNFVYTHMGFDTFTSSEFMNNQEMTPNGWIKDKILIGEIDKVLNSTKKKDFVFAVSVQGHGEYPSDVTEMIENPKITVTGLEDEARNNKLTYFANQINEMDQFVKELIEYLLNYPEDVILAIYGDHLPSIEFTNDELENGSIFETEYIIWSNFEKKEKKEDIEAYQLGSKILNTIGIHDGVMTKYHQYYEKQKNKKGYIANMKLIEYDMLYGNRYILGKENPFKPMNMQMGTYPMSITDVRKEGEETVVVEGGEYTPYTTIYINGKRMQTEFISETEVRCQNELQYGDEVQIVQESKKGKRLSESKIYYY